MAFLGPSLRRKKVTDRPGARVAISTVASVLLNAALIGFMARMGAFEPMKMQKTEQVALAPLTSDQWNANRSIQGSPPAVAPAPQPATPPPAVQPPPVTKREVQPPPEEKHPSGQVVDVAPSNNSKPPKESRFLSDRDNTVEKETRSRWAGTEVFKNRAPAPVHGKEGEQQPPKEVGEGGAGKETREARAGEGGKSGRTGKDTAERKESAERKPSPSAPDERLAMLEPPQKPGLLGPAPPQPPSGEKPPGAGEEGLGKPGAPGDRQGGQRKAGDPRLLPSVESMSRITAGPSNDYIDRDVEEGDATALNTRGFKFATFWNRFKQDVTSHWRPAIVYNERDPNGTMFGDRPERATGLHVILDANGALKEVKVVEPSGLDFLDREAVRAIRAAAPFYNVPAGLVDEKGEVSFSFGMVLVMNRAIPVRPHYQPGSAE